MEDNDVLRISHNSQKVRPAHNTVDTFWKHCHDDIVKLLDKKQHCDLDLLSLMYNNILKSIDLSGEVDTAVADGFK